MRFDNRIMNHPVMTTEAQVLVVKRRKPVANVASSESAPNGTRLRFALARPHIPRPGLAGHLARRDNYLGNRFALASALLRKTGAQDNVVLRLFQTSWRLAPIPAGLQFQRRWSLEGRPGTGLFAAICSAMPTRKNLSCSNPPSSACHIGRSEARRRDTAFRGETLPLVSRRLNPAGCWRRRQ